MEEVIRNAFLDELENISKTAAAPSGTVEFGKNVIKKVKDFYAAHPTAVKRVGAGSAIVGGTLVGRQAASDWSLGRQIRKQQERAMAQRG